jgi:wyosine [tRNA(Phe)-imidazoG37] synthetase (radical SAM superfamily)
MSNQDKQKQLINELRQFFLANSHATSEEQIMTFLGHLREYATEHSKSFEDVIKAIRQAAKDVEFVPRVSSIIKFLKPSDEDMDAELSSMTSEAMTTIRRLLAEGRGERPRFENASMQQAYESTMQREWNDCDEFDKYFAMTIKKNLKSFKGSGAYQQSLQLQEAKEKQERLEYYANGGGLLK